METDNELIAEFMGAERREGQRAFNPDQKIVQWIIKGNPCNQHRDDIRHWYQPVELKYHESWDWLMPVIEKIETIKGVHTVISELGCDIYSFGKRISDSREGTKLKTVHKAVVTFIKWYNQQKQ